MSGNLSLGQGDNPIFSAFAERTQLQLGLPGNDDRHIPNTRWLLKYTQGIMDTDALSNLIFGELYVPVTIEVTDKPIELAWSWTFPVSMKSAVSQYACRFANPFWSPFNVQGNERTTTLPNGTVITETLQHQEDTSYSYTMTGIEGLASYMGSFSLLDLEPSDTLLTLKWTVSFMCSTPQIIISIASMLGGTVQQMTSRMSSYFGPGV